MTTSTGRSAARLVLVREVLLHADGRAVVMAHSVVARRDVEGPWRSLAGLGTRPLAAVLFADPRVRRSAFEYARIDRRHALWKRACRLLGRELPVMRARRSVFRRNGRPLMVTELFLPALAELRR
jgi:chorismate--pyruvate lyase